MRIEGKLRWVHSASTSRHNLIFVQNRRGTQGMDAAGALPCFTGVAMHDVWAPYDSYTSVTHALCGAHILKLCRSLAVRDRGVGRRLDGQRHV